MASQIDFNVDAVLPAGGVGHRMGLETPKQFVNVCGRPLICYALDTFESVPWIKKVAVPVAADWRALMDNIIKEEGYSKIVLSDGKDTRHRSIYDGIKSLNASNPDVVIIHDAVRPLVEEETLRSVAIAAKDFGASGAVRPLVSTILMTDEEGLLDHSLVRSKCRASEMPQAFQFDVIKNAYSKATEHDFVYGTECLQLALAYSGVKAKLIEGPPSLWKITYQSDLDALKKILQERFKIDVYVCNVSKSNSQFYQHILESLKSLNFKFDIVQQIHIGSTLSREQLIMNDKKSHFSKKTVLFFLDDFQEDSGVNELRSTCRKIGFTIIIFVCSDNVLLAKEFLTQARQDSSMESTISCIVYPRNYIPEMKTTVCRDVADLVERLIQNESRTFHGQMFEF